MIADVLTHYGADLTAVRENGWRAVRCPFHDDRHASGRVNLDLGGFACMACGMKGDALKLIATREGLDRRHAVEWAEEILGASVEGLPRATSKRKPSRWRDQLFPDSRNSDDPYS